MLAFLVSAGVFQSGSYHWMPSAVYASQQLPRDSTASDANANLLSCSGEIGHSAEPAQRLEQLNAWSRLNGWRLEAVGAQQHMQLQTNPCKLTAPTVCCSGAVSAPGRGSEMWYTFRLETQNQARTSLILGSFRPNTCAYLDRLHWK